MNRNRIPSLRTLAGVAVAVTAIACADRAGPTALADLGAGAEAARDSATCDLTISGTIWRYSGTGDSTSDTLGARVPLPGARIELRLVAPLPGDSVPDDSIPDDSIPNDTIPNDTIPRDSVGDSLGLRGLVLRAARAPGDTAGRPDSTRGPVPQPDYKATSRGDGSYSIEGVCPGIYRIDIIEPGGTGRSIFTYLVVRDDMTNVSWTFPPRRR